ncbi:MAG: DUF3035 domain-containing protein [Sedimentitalea sp.]
MRIALVLSVLGVAVVLAGCSNKGLRSLRHDGEGPDEFKVLPSKQLSEPENYAQLPEPTPGGSNRVDATPKADAVAALGGRPAALVPGAIPAGDSALVTQASRFGVPADTRASLAAADAKFRKRQARLTGIKLFPVDRYEQAYRRQAMDPFGTNDRFQRAGIATPTAPPVNE